MPIGPSHGGRGGGGGFSSSRGGNSRRSSGGGNLLGALIGGMIGGAISSGRRERHYENRGDDSYESNEPATPSRRRPTVFLVLAIVMAVITFFTIMSAISFSNKASIMKTDYEDYKSLITIARDQKSLADSDPSKTHFITTASFSDTKYTNFKPNPTTKGIYLDFTVDNVQYYFIVYTYKDESGATHTGTTHSQFSSSQATGWDGEIAYAKIDGEYVSMNTSYTSKAIEECAEYKYTRSLVSRNIWIAVGGVVLIALFVFIYIKKLRKYHKLVKEDEIAYSQKQQAEVNEAQAKAETAQKEADQKNRVCAFCGSTVPDDEDICPACGSRTFE